MLSLLPQSIVSRSLCAFLSLLLGGGGGFGSFFPRFHHYCISKAIQTTLSQVGRYVEQASGQMDMEKFVCPFWIQFEDVPNRNPSSVKIGPEKGKKVSRKHF